MSDEAAKLFKAQRYAEAAERIEQAYALDPTVRVRLRNAGRAWQEAGNAARALHCFERFLALETDPALRKDTEERIAAVRKAGGGEDSGRSPAGAASASPSSTKGSEPPAPGGRASPAAATTAATPVITATAGSPGRALPIALAGAGVSVWVAGAAWHLRTAAADDTVAEGERSGQYAYPGGDKKLGRDRETLATNRAVAWSLVGAGAVGAGVGAWLWLRAPRTEAGASVSGMPTGGRDGGGFVAAARF